MAKNKRIGGNTPINQQGINMENTDTTQNDGQENLDQSQQQGSEDVTENNGADTGVTGTAESQQPSGDATETTTQETSTVTQTAETVSAPVVETPVETPAPVVAAPVVIAVEKYGAAINTGFSLINEYVEKMAPNQMHDETSGGRQQRNLRQAISTIVNSVDESNYQEVFKDMFAIISDNKEGVFHEYNVLRFVSGMGLTHQQTNQWARLITGFVALSDVKSRKAVAGTVDIENMIAEANFSATGTSFIVSFLDV